MGRVLAGLGRVQDLLPSLFRKCKAEVENQTEKKIKCIKSGNEGEYELAEYSKLCEENGIILKRTVPGKPRHHGVVERMNRMLTESARSMRLKVGVSKTLWANSISTTAYLINRGTSVPLKFKFSEEVWSGKEVNLSFLNYLFMLLTFNLKNVTS